MCGTYRVQSKVRDEMNYEAKSHDPTKTGEAGRWRPTSPDLCCSFEVPETESASAQPNEWISASITWQRFA
jgi:hypothetical protein